MKIIEWAEHRLRIIDQTKLPWEEAFLELADYQEVAKAIMEMRVRGAPAIGIAVAYGVALGAQAIAAQTRDEFMAELGRVMQTLSATRPTAVNLFYVLQRMNAVAQEEQEVSRIKDKLVAEALRIHVEEEEATRALSRFGAELIEDGSTVLTHCNAGALATTGYGTALGVLRAAREQGKRVQVLATETRPLLQGARLTVWELMREGIPVTLITDSMAGYFMMRGEVNCVVVGADRIAANGDVANKIGTYTLAVLAMESGIPFYVAAPSSSIDLSLSSGDKIPIEERSPEEVTHIRGMRIAPEGVKAANPAFDVTPSYYITAIITERGVVREPYEMRLKKMLK
jgi:methylthioribose-1-phosphate isomerase